MDIRLILLMLGAISGVLIATANLLLTAESRTEALPANAIASVDGQIITREDYATQIKSLAVDKRNPLSAKDQQRALERLIEEELLILRGLEVGLIHSAPTVRKAITAAMINQIVSESAALRPDNAKLKIFYQENQAQFTRPERLRVRHIRIDTEEQARQAYERLNVGEHFDSIARAFAQHTAFTLPDALLPLVKISEYIGPSLMKQTMQMQQGEISEPMLVGHDWHILWLVEREISPPPDFSDVAEQVRFAYQRKAADDALQDYLDWLKQRADVKITPDLAANHP